LHYSIMSLKIAISSIFKICTSLARLFRAFFISKLYHNNETKSYFTNYELCRPRKRNAYLPERGPQIRSSENNVHIYSLISIIE